MGPFVFFTITFFILKIYNCNSYLFKSTLNCLQNGIGHYCVIVCFILVSIKLLNRYSMGNAGGGTVKAKQTKINTNIERSVDIIINIPIFAHICHNIYLHVNV